MSRADALISRSARMSFQVDIGVLVPAFVAMLTLQMFRAEQHRWLPALWMETAILIVLPFILLWRIRKWSEKSDISSKSKSFAYVAQGGAFFVGLFAVGWQLVSRKFGLGDATEIVALLVLQSISWHLAVFSKVPGFEKVSLVLCSAIVFFVCSMTERMAIFVLSAVFAVFCLWWLSGMYWNRLNDKAIDGQSRILPVRSVAITISAVVIGGIGLAVAQSPTIKNQIGARGFSPFSGGENGYEDEFARAGFGDGHMLAAGNNATTTGAVDSDQFIEDHKESLYDVSVKRYDGPVFKRPRTRSVAIDAITKHLHEVKQSEQSGKTFRTMRESEEVLDIELENKATEALFFVEGSVPVRFAIDNFSQFDGWDWSKSDIGETGFVLPKIQLQSDRGGSFYQICHIKPDFLAKRRHHRVKMMRLQSSSLPSPAFLDRWRISYVQNPSLFRWNDTGVVRMAGEYIPTHTVIDMESRVPNFHVLADDSNRPKFKRDLSTGDVGSESALPFLQVPENATQEAIEALAEKWTFGYEPGWDQVNAIVQNMRQCFELNPSWEVDENAEDTIGLFLEQGGGPSYMFATTCAMILRAAGYETRMTSGFLVQKDDYDRIAKQSIVTSDNLHMWPEVCFDQRFWIPVEPTPGYPIPYSTETLWEWFTTKIFAVMDWVKNHPVVSSLLSVATVLAIVFRAELISLMLLLWWHFNRLFWRKGLLKATRQLIDARFWAAGNKRPASETIRTWYVQVEPGLSTGFFELWNAKNYCSNPRRVSRTDLVSKCRELVDAVTLHKIRGIQQKMKKDDSRND